MHIPPRWVVAVSVGVAAAIMGDSLLYAVLPTQFAYLGLEVGMVGVLLSGNRFVRLISNPVAGFVMGRWGTRKPFLLAVFVAACTTAVYALGFGFLALLLARLLWGVCWSFLRLGGYMAALEASHDGNRGYYLGFFNGVTRFGSFIAALLGGFMTDFLGFRETVLTFAAVTVIGGLGVANVRSPRPVSLPSPASQSSPKEPPVSAGAPSDPPPKRLESTGSSARLWFVYFAVFLHGMAVSGLVTSTLGLWLLTLYGSSSKVLFFTIGVASISGSLVSARFLSDFLWGPLSGHLSDRHGRAVFAVIAVIVEAAAFGALAQGGGLPWTAAAALALFVAATAFQVTLDATVGDLAEPSRRASTMSWYATWLDLGAAIGPLVGYLVGAGVGLDWMYRGSAALLALVGAVYFAAFTARLGLKRQRAAIS